MKKANYDVVVFGATSFVGKLLVAYLAEHQARSGEPFSWALAARNQAKLEAVRQSLGEAWQDLPLIVADANNPDSLQALCQQTRVVVSTVGPYALYGEPLVKACVASGTDYCDLNGEVQWAHRMITQYRPKHGKAGQGWCFPVALIPCPPIWGASFYSSSALNALMSPPSGCKCAHAF